MMNVMTMTMNSSGSTNDMLGHWCGRLRCHSRLAPHDEVSLHRQSYRHTHVLVVRRVDGPSQHHCSSDSLHSAAMAYLFVIH